MIGNNIKSNGDLNPMLPGHRVMAIFGFCDIRQFTDATEVLQEEVMEFVNSIAKIVHLEVSPTPLVLAGTCAARQQIHGRQGSYPARLDAHKMHATGA